MTAPSSSALRAAAVERGDAGQRGCRPARPPSRWDRAGDGAQLAPRRRRRQQHDEPEDTRGDAPRE